MSRVIVKNLPKKITEGRLREIFSFDGEITDIRMVKTPGGQFRRFAFVGYKTEKQAETAVKFFNQSFIDTSKLEVVTLRCMKNERLTQRVGTIFYGEEINVGQSKI